MIQRIQTVYMFFAAALMGLMLVFPLANFLGGNESFRLMAFGVESCVASTAADQSPTIISTVYMGILISLCALVPFVNIFLYRRRWLQVRLCIVEIVLLVGAQIYVVYYLYRSMHSVASFEVHKLVCSVVDIFPLLSGVLIYLAFRAVIRDEALVKSLNRIR